MGEFELKPGQKWAIGISVTVVTIGLILLFLWMFCVIPSIGKPLARCSKASKTSKTSSPKPQSPTPTCGGMADTCSTKNDDYLPCCEGQICWLDPFTKTYSCSPDVSDGPCIVEDDTCSTDGGENCCDGLVCQPGSFEGTSVCTPICIEDNDECGTPQMYQCCNSNSVCDDTGKCTPST